MRNVIALFIVFSGVFAVPLHAEETAGKTAIGGSTIEVLAMNDDQMIELRSTLREEGVFPW